MAAPHAFLDILANPQVRDAYLAGRISIILSSDLETILWANGVGARFMGFRTVAESIGVDSGFDRLTRHQIESGLSDVRPVRVRGIPQSEAFLVNAVTMAPLGDVVFLRSVAASADEGGMVDLTDGLNDEMTEAAVLDLNGHVMRASPGFDPDLFDTGELAELLEEANRDNGVKKRFLKKNKDMPVGVLQLNRNPHIFLLIAAKLDMHDDEGKIEPDEGFVFDPQKLPTRFVWHVDKDGHFTDVSPELASSVGPRFGNIDGRSFSELAAEWNIDANGALRALFKSHNAWSGRKIYWPVEGQQKRVEIEFFALPVYSRSRDFTGFRGFGIISETKSPSATITREPINTQKKGLSPQEHEAFSAIARKLKADILAIDTLDASALNVSGQDKETALDLTLSERPVETAKRIEERNTADKTALSSEPTFLSENNTAENTSDTYDNPEKPENDTGADFDTAQDAQTDATAKTYEEYVETTDGAQAVADNNAIAADETFLSGSDEQLSSEPDEEDNIDAFHTPKEDEGAGSVAEIPFEFSLLRQVPLAILVYRDNRVLFANDMLLEITGFPTLDSFRANGVLSVILREWLPKNILLGATGDVHNVRAQMRAVTWSDGTPASMISFVPEEGRNTALEEELEALQRKAVELSVLLNLVSDGVFILDSNGVVNSVNESATRMFSLSPDEIKGQIFTRFFTEGSLETVNTYFNQAKQEGFRPTPSEGREVEATGTDGRKLSLHISFARMELAQGYFLMIRDLTPLQKIATELVRARYHAEEGSRRKSRYLAMVSHEIRTPLNAVIGLSQLMLEEKYGPLANDRYRNYLRDIVRSGEHIMTLINDLLDAAKIAEGKQVLDVRPIALSPILNDVLALMTPQANAGRIIMRSSIAADLPAILADERSVKQIVLNLVSNAIRFTPQGGQIIVSALQHEPGEVLLRIRDTGVGMNAVEMEEAMKPYQQVERHDHREGGAAQGTGLGLPLAKALAEANNARFLLRSQPGKGTVAEIVFMISDDNNDRNHGHAQRTAENASPEMPLSQTAVQPLPNKPAAPQVAAALQTMTPPETTAAARPQAPAVQNAPASQPILQEGTQARQQDQDERLNIPVPPEKKPSYTGDNS